MRHLPPEVVPGVAIGLSRLAADHRLAIICNTGYTLGGVLRERLAAVRPASLLRLLVLLRRGRVKQAEHAGLHQVLAALDVQPHEAAHVGDSQRNDVAAARAAGMLAVHFIGINSRDAAASTGHLLIHRFDELPVALADSQVS